MKLKKESPSLQRKKYLVLAYKKLLQQKQQTYNKSNIEQLGKLLVFLAA